MNQPLKNFEELISWEPKDIPPHHPLINYGKDKLLRGEREIMVCHDMKGGYLPEESDAGCDVDRNAMPYVFLNWWNIDVFCYFSHVFVTIPPSGYINAAHKHGCLVLGTLITEKWSTPKGEDLCAQILQDEETAMACAEKLVQIAVAYNFDGWLINIENKLKTETQIGLMEIFLSQLTRRMREEREFSRVIWYDSVTVFGNLFWQNALNRKNKNFYDVCDGIYLNYNWSDDELLTSADYGKLNRIYIGVDVFGRGCIGEWQCHKPFKKAKFFRMSVAIFATGWVAEKFPQEDPIAMGLKFWNLLNGSVPERGITGPFETDFHPGLSESKFCLNAMNIQPNLLMTGLKPCVGGGVLAEQPGNFILFNCEMTHAKIKVTITASYPIQITINGTISSEMKEEVNAEIDSEKLWSIGFTSYSNNTVIQSFKCVNL